MTREAILRHIADAQAEGDRFFREGYSWLARIRWMDAQHLRARLRGLPAIS